MINFDLISDLHLTTLHNEFTWVNKATSLFCIVAGNVSDDHDVVFEFLEELGQHYEAVFFIDGDIEHDRFNGDFDASYKSLASNIKEIPNVIFLHENIIILNGATIIGTNGWSTFDFTGKNLFTDTIEFLHERGGYPADISNGIIRMAVTDQHYLYQSIKTCQDMPEVDDVIVVSNSVPLYELISHDHDYDGTVLGDIAGNTGIVECLANDTSDKVSTWIFGKYYGDLDFEIGGVRYVNNTMQSSDLASYYPKIITI